jgi:hypothetical protein
MLINRQKSGNGKHENFFYILYNKISINNSLIIKYITYNLTSHIMNIQYEIKQINEYGKGIYALSCIKKDTLIWSYKLNENVFEYTEKECIQYLKELPSLIEQQYFLSHTFGRGDVLCLIMDDGIYMNHADEPDSNCKTDLLTGDCFATRDIIHNEQLFENYSSFSHPPFLYELLKYYQCEPTYYDFKI